MNPNIAGFDLPLLDEGDKLNRILASTLGNQLPTATQLSYSYQSISQLPQPYWDATHFGLERVAIFQDASSTEQQAIAQIASQGLLLEAYFVEKAGMGYMAKMLLLAETLEERMLYSLFAAEEATHLAQIRGFFAPQDEGEEKESTSTDDPFLRFLSDLLETEDKAILLFIIQVVLEGWGLSHYRSLAKGCSHLELGQLFEQFLQAEARHHGSGLMLFNQISLSKPSQSAIVEALILFLRMVQVGPQRVLSAIAQVKGDLSRLQQIQVLQELETEIQSGARLSYLRSLMQKTTAHAIVQELEERGSFKPFPAEKCI
ncbi:MULTISPECIES: ferritin-like domain-containing protein [Trichocoleus]|uniref:Ferritin-like domain-containing protein n=1 Tax=Trichocoleus desertorum GB2-A4 TaxID=2933944 RepID=A0ABV0J732_9CYAN|nr:ferritin-like domain-containing protein [Trichocoleus sp. FACHB-46]MBD1862556.1 ferritin-like domain-containing protein [Trichocoleus sp. FACHB-46]